MATAIGPERVLAWLDRFGELLGEHDPQSDLAKGMSVVTAQLPAHAEAIGTLLTSAGVALVGAVGGTDGPYYGTFFVRCGMSAELLSELDAPALAIALRGGLDGVRARELPKSSDTSMADSLEEAVIAFAAAVSLGAELGQAAEAALSAARSSGGENAPTTLLFEALAYVISPD